MIKRSWLSNCTVQACAQNTGTTPEFFFWGGRCHRWISLCRVCSANQPYWPWSKEFNLHIVSAQYAWKKRTLKALKQRNITFVETYKHIKCILGYIAKVESTNHEGQLAFSENITQTNQKQMSDWHEHERLHLKSGGNTKWSQNCSATGYQWKTGLVDRARWTQDESYMSV